MFYGCISVMLSAWQKTIGDITVAFDGAAFTTDIASVVATLVASAVAAVAAADVAATRMLVNWSLNGP